MAQNTEIIRVKKIFKDHYTGSLTYSHIYCGCGGEMTEFAHNHNYSFSNGAVKDV
jgi:hypothetical protein